MSENQTPEQAQCVYEDIGQGWRRCVTHNTIPSPSLDGGVCSWSQQA